MGKDIVITTFYASSEGVVFQLNKPTKLKGKTLIISKEFWVSWDRIGESLFENYTELSSVEDRNKLRQTKDLNQNDHE